MKPPYPAPTEDFILTGRHVAMALGLFAFVVVSVNSLFIYYGITTFPGLVVENYYERGRNFNQTLTQAEVQSQLGWRSQVSLTPKANKSAQLVVIIDEISSKEPVSHVAVQAHLKRTIHDKDDQMIDMNMVAPGVYMHEFESLSAGRWQIDLTAHHADSQDTYHMTHKVVLRP